MAEERRGFAGYGYETAGGDRVTALRDMIDGGGKGRSGGEFEGGGILSLIANMVASPYGSERERSFGMIPGERSPQAPMESVRPVPRPESAVVEELLGRGQAAYGASEPPGVPYYPSRGGGQAALPPGLVQNLPSLASEMVARGLSPEMGQPLSEILASLTPEDRQTLLPQILTKSDVPMDQLLRR